MQFQQQFVEVGASLVGPMNVVKCLESASLTSTQVVRSLHSSNQKLEFKWLLFCRFSHCFGGSLWGWSDEGCSSGLFEDHHWWRRDQGADIHGAPWTLLQGLANKSVSFYWYFTKCEKMLFFKHTIKVCVSCFWERPRTSMPSTPRQMVSLYLQFWEQGERLRVPWRPLC